MPVTDTSAAFLSVITEYLEAFVHQVLFHRGLYAADLFVRHRLYGIAVRKARHPQLNNYVLLAVESVKVMAS